MLERSKYRRPIFLVSVSMTAACMLFFLYRTSGDSSWLVPRLALSIGLVGIAVMTVLEFLPRRR